MKIKLDPGAFTPTRAHETDAGLDIYAKDTQLVPAHGCAIFETGIHIQLPHGHAGLLKSKSGLNTLFGITSDGTIDEGYSGEIKAKLYNHSDHDYWVTAGDKITQLLIVPVLYEHVEIVDEIESGDRGTDGFGSTGK